MNLNQMALWLCGAKTSPFMQKKRHSRSGFILVAVLTVLSLITILVVAALIVSRSELKAARNMAYVEEARQNALFGLDQALNQLQSAAGPDRRITARADILNASQTPAPTSVGFKNPLPANDSGQAFWTGVWRNTNNDFSGCAGNGNGSILKPDPAAGQTPGPGGSFLYYDYTPDGLPNPTATGTDLSPNQTTAASRAQLYNMKNVQWLISWPLANIIPDPTDTLANQIGAIPFPLRSNQNYQLSGNQLFVTLAKGLNTATNQVALQPAINTVQVPRVPILGQYEQAGNPINVAVGSYAYWVSDEGIKAKTDIPDLYLTATTDSASLAHFTIAQSNNVSTAINQNKASFTSIDGNSTFQDVRGTAVITPSLAAMAYSDSLQSWLDFGLQPNYYSTDFTVNSYGVLADSFNGGLRKDLTAALENNLLYQNYFGDGAGTESTRKVYSVNALLSGYATPFTYKCIDGASTVQNNPKMICLDGLRWDSLFYYYNLYHTNMPSPIVGGGNAPYKGIGGQFSSELAGQPPNLTARIYQENDPGGSGLLLDMDGLPPLLTYWRYSFGMDLHYLTGSGSGPYTYDFVVGHSPALALYNPFDVNLSEPNNATIEKKSNVGQYLGLNGKASSSNKPPLIFTISGADSYGPVAINPPDIDMTTAVDGVPFAPGEMRLYAISNSTAYTTNTAERDGPNGPGGQVRFSATNLNPIPYGYPYCLAKSGVITVASTGCSSLNMWQEEIKSPTNGTISLNKPAQDTVSIVSPHQHYENAYTSSPLLRNLYHAWPNKGSGQPGLFCDNTWLSGTGSGIGNSNLPSDYTTGKFDQVSGTFTIPGPGISKMNNLPDSNLAMCVNLEDHAPGTAMLNNFVSYLPNSPAMTNVGFPFLSAGGCALNSLNTDHNAYIRDYQNTTRCQQSVITNTSLLQTFNSTVNGTNVVDVKWLPGSAGTPGSVLDRVILHDVPRQPLLSVGQFKNMFCRYEPDYYTAYINSLPPKYLPFPYNNPLSYRYLGFSNYPVGGSYLAGIPPYCSFVATFGTNYYSSGPGADAAAYGMPAADLFQDDNFLANEVLFDGYFFSTIPPNGVLDFANWPITNPFSQNYIDNNGALPNGRLVYYRRPIPGQTYVTPRLADLQPQNAVPPGYAQASAILRKPAANLLVNGAFNVNSTSVTAWMSLLSSTATTSGNAKLKTFLMQETGAASTVSSKTFSNNEIPFLNFFSAIGVSGISKWGSVDSNVPWFSAVDVSSATVLNLAQQIVVQIKQRGPFLSLGDFLNHRLRPPSALSDQSDTYSQSGALQAAIDTVGINSNTVAASQSNPAGMAYSTPNPGNPSSSSTTIHNAADLVFTNSQNACLPAVAQYTQNIFPLNPAATGTGVPGTLLQNDLVQAIGPVMATRSDTFTVRVYGQAVGPLGETEAEVYGEAVIQRVPEYICSSENQMGTANRPANYAYDDPSPSTLNTSGTLGLSPENSQFGRRFKVVSFRWLKATEL